MIRVKSPTTIEDLLRMRAKAHRKTNPSTTPFAGMEGFVLTYARHFHPKPYPRRLNAFRGEEHACFKNAWWMVLESKGKLRYVEGFAAQKDSLVRYGKTLYPNAILHGWAIDEHDRVIDPTWMDKGSLYFGVVFDFGYCLKTAVRKREHTSLIGNFRDGFPLLTGKHTEADWMPREK
jgi:hypothetical protein